MFRDKPPAGWVPLTPTEERSLLLHSMLPLVFVRRKCGEGRGRNALPEFDTYAPPWALDVNRFVPQGSSIAIRMASEILDLVALALSVGEPSGAEIVDLALAQFALGGQVALRDFVEEERARVREEARRVGS